jgi:menaquinone-dependent protoporphyrinogen oxidase
MRALVIYATKSGCTAGIADRIGSALEQAGADVTVQPADSAASPEGFDLVIVGSGVRAGSWHQAVKSWVVEHADTLKRIPVALFTCGLMITQGAEKEAEVRAYTDALIEEAGIEPVDVALLAGWNQPSSFSVPERLIMKLMKAPVGDFRDWAAVEDWARGVAARSGDA